MDLEEMKSVCLKLLEESEAAYLTTIDEKGFPHTRAMLNLRRPSQFPSLVGLFREHTDEWLIYFSTNTASEKIRHIRANPLVSVYYCVPREYRGVMLGGSMEIVADRSIKQALWQNNWNLYYPQGVDDPDYAVLHLFPAFAKGWYQLTRFEFSV